MEYAAQLRITGLFTLRRQQAARLEKPDFHNRRSRPAESSNKFNTFVPVKL
jgi:hypothetical protein